MVLASLLKKHASKGLLVDTNILLMYLIGLHDPGYIPNFRRTNQYTAEDFQLVHRFVRPFHRLISTPHVLTELSNLSKGVPRSRTDRYFSALIGLLRPAREVYVEKDTLLKDPRLPRLGFTDLSILEAGRQLGCLVLTDDFAVATIIQSEGLEAINFNHLRQLAWSV